MRWLAIAGAAIMIGQTSAPVTPGVHLAYADSGGTGVAIVLMHAATAGLESWEHQTPAFVKAGYRVIAFERRGWGRTTVDPDAPAGTAADDLIALMDMLHIERFHLVGTAAGGFVTFDTALSYPQRLRSVVVANSIGGVQDPDFVELGQRLRPKEFAAMPAAVRELSPSYRASNPNGAARWAQIESVSRPQGSSLTQPLKNRITFAALESIRVPTLLLTGDADMFAPPPVLKMFAQHIRQAKTIVVPEAGHSTFWEQPDVFNQAVLDFVRQH